MEHFEHGPKHDEEPSAKPFPADKPKRPNGKVPRSALDFRISEDEIDRLARREGTRMRGLTAIRKLAATPMDPIVLDALEAVRSKFVGDRADANRKTIATRYLDRAEKVTESLNRKSLSRTTRLLLGVDGLYEELLLRAIDNLEKANGQDVHAVDEPA